MAARCCQADEHPEAAGARPASRSISEEAVYAVGAFNGKKLTSILRPELGVPLFVLSTLEMDMDMDRDLKV